MGGELDQVMNENSKQEENFYSNSDDSSTSSYDVQTNKKTQESDIYGPKRQNTGVSIESTPAVKQGDKTNEYGSPAIFDNGIPRISTGYIFNPKYDHWVWGKQKIARITDKNKYDFACNLYHPLLAYSPQRILPKNSKL
jgi:hypothetical protein